MATHELKTHPQAFTDVRDGRKTFEIRWDDRNFHVGDHLVLKEWDPETREYTGQKLHRTVNYMLLGGQFGLPLGYVVMAIEERWREPLEIRKLLALATSDPGHFAGFKGDRSLGQWMADAVIIAMRREGAFLSIPDDVATARAQGRSEALALLLKTDAETFADDYIGSHPIADTGDYGAHWEEKPLRELLRADLNAFSLMSEAEGEYWHNLGLRIDAEHDLPKGLRQRVATLEAAMHEACDLLAERIHDNPARSPAHNARLTLESALKALDKRPWRDMSQLQPGKDVIGINAKGDIRRIWRFKPSSRTDRILTFDQKPFKAVGWLPLDALPPTTRVIATAVRGEETA